MKKKVLALFLAAVMTSALAACGDQKGEKAAADNGGDKKTESAKGEEKPVELSFSGVTSENAKKAAEKLADLVKEYSDGTVTLKLFQDNQLGPDATVVEMAQTGDCDIALSSTSSVTTMYPDYAIYDMPYLFMSKQEVYDVGFGGEAGKKIKDGVEAVGLKGLGMWENGFRNLTTNNKEVKKPEDLKGLKIRTMENDVHLAAWKAMGANPTPMNFSEVFTALQQGTVDGQENPIGIIIGNKFQEIEKYCIYTEHVYTPYCMVMNLDKWNSLSENQQNALQKAVDEATKDEFQLSQEIEDSADKTMEDAGVTVIHLTAEEKGEFKKAVDSADCLGLIKKQMKNPDLAEEMVKELEAYRNK